MKKSGLDDTVSLHTVAADLASFLIVSLQAVKGAHAFTLTWRKGGPWVPAHIAV